MAAGAKRELVQHGAMSVTLARDGTTTRQSTGRLPRHKEQVVVPDPKAGKAQSHSLAKQRSSILTPWCLRWSFQEHKGNLFQIQIKHQFKTRSLQKQVDL